MNKLMVGLFLAGFCGCQCLQTPQKTELEQYLDFIGEIARSPDDSARGVFSPSATTFEYQRKYEVVFADKKHVSFRAKEYAYAGGAHGGTTVTVGTFDRSNGRILKLKDVVSADRLPALTKALRAAVVAKLGGEDRLQAEVRPHDNFFIAKDGLHFVYNEYQVACYAAGTIEVVVDPKTCK